MIVKVEDKDIYLPDDVYDRLLDALSKVQPVPAIDGKLRAIEPWQFVEVLGEVGGIWSADTLCDTVHAVKN